MKEKMKIKKVKLGIRQNEYLIRFLITFVIVSIIFKCIYMLLAILDEVDVLINESIFLNIISSVFICIFSIGVSTHLMKCKYVLEEKEKRLLCKNLIVFFILFFIVSLATNLVSGYKSYTRDKVTYDAMYRISVSTNENNEEELTKTTEEYKSLHELKSWINEQKNKTLKRNLINPVVENIVSIIIQITWVIVKGKNLEHNDD